jgi:DNA transformation protein
MDRDFLIDLFAGFGPVTIRRMFSGFGISADGFNFALALRGGLYLRADEGSIPRFEAEGAKPFQYQTRTKTVTVGSYWQLPERLYDDPEELTDWARAALASAQRAALRKRPKVRKGAKAAARKAATKTPVTGKSPVKRLPAPRKRSSP